MKGNLTMGSTMTQKFHFNQLMGLAVAVVMIAGVVMLFCPCSHAESTPQPVIQSQPCQHCCPEINTSSLCDGVTVEKLNVAALNVENLKLSFNFQSQFENVDLVLVNDVSRLSALGSPPSAGLKASPLYLSLQVLRI